MSASEALACSCCVVLPFIPGKPVALKTANIRWLSGVSEATISPWAVSEGFVGGPPEQICQCLPGRSAVTPRRVLSYSVTGGGVGLGFGVAVGIGVGICVGVAGVTTLQPASKMEAAIVTTSLLLIARPVG